MQVQQNLQQPLPEEPQQMEMVQSISQEETLPSGWTTRTDPNGRIYYQNDITKQTQWVKPSTVNTLEQNIPTQPSNNAPKPMQQPQPVQQIVVYQQPIQKSEPLPKSVALQISKYEYKKEKKGVKHYCDFIYAIIIFILGIFDHSSSLILAKEWLGGVYCTLWDEPVDLGLEINAQFLIGLVFIGLIFNAADIYWTIEQFFIDKTCLFDNRQTQHNSFFLSLLGVIMLIFGDITIMCIQFDAGATTGSRSDAWQLSFYLSAATVAIVSMKGMYDAKQLIRYKCACLPIGLNCFACCPINCCLVLGVLVLGGTGTMFGSSGVIVVNNNALPNSVGVEVDRTDYLIDDKIFDFNCTQHSKLVGDGSTTRKSREVSCNFICRNNCDDGVNGICSEVFVGTGARIQENTCQSGVCGETNIEVCYTRCDGKGKE
eukprot:212186_1